MGFETSAGTLEKLDTPDFLLKCDKVERNIARILQGSRLRCNRTQDFEDLLAVATNQEHGIVGRRGRKPCAITTFRPGDGP